MNQEIQIKECSKCHSIKPIIEFNNNKRMKDGHYYYCKVCKKESNHLFYLDNKIISNEKSKQWRIDNPDKIDQCTSRQPDYQREYNKKYWLLKKNDPVRKAKHTQYSHNRYINNSMAHLTAVQRNLIRQIIKTFKDSKFKKLHTHDLLCCTSLFLKQHIEKQFTEGMSWDNYGNKIGQWSIDHIIPRSFFNEYLTDITEQKLCFHYGNLRPMWHHENMRKSDNIPNLNFIY